jgi:tetratricopeptide (TPR) repeat protein
MADVTAPDYPVGDDDGGDFDLAAALSGALDTTGPVPPAAARAGTTEEEGFEQVFAAFKVGVERELGDGDHETHYDLGIAYREMGLVEDAIAEFRKALGASGRQLSALHMMSLCALDLGRVGDAVSHLEQALALPEIPEPQQAVLRYDLARAHEEQGDAARARAAYEAVLAHDPDFADAAERLAALADAPAAEAAVEPEEGLESFDGLVEEASAAEGGFESFDDLMADVAEEAEEDAGAPAEAGTPEPDPQAEPGPAASEPPEDPPDGGGGSGGRRGRRKKISFV